MNFKRFTILIFLVCLFLECGKKQEQSNANKQYVSAVGGLKMRDMPNKDGKAIALIPQGSEVVVLEETGQEEEVSGRRGKWAKIRYGSQEGFVFGGFLASELPSVDLSLTTASFREADQGRCNGIEYNAWSLYFEPDFKAKKVNEVGDASGNYLATKLGAYKTSVDGQIIEIQWTSMEEQEGDVGKPLSPKKTKQVNETEKLNFCECEGNKALCEVGGYPRYVHWN